jgi:hypothetical protein
VAIPDELYTTYERLVDAFTKGLHFLRKWP